MKPNFTLFFIMLFANLTVFSQRDSLRVYYYENFPYAYTERTATLPDKGLPKGIEIEIIQEYVHWLKQKKGIQLKVSYTLFTDFGAFYTSVKDAKPSVIGLGSVTRNAEREKEVSFSAAYMNNQAVLITHGSVLGIKEKNSEWINKILGGMNGITLSKSSLEGYLNELKTNYLKDLKIVYASKPSGLLDSISSNRKLFGYSDLVSYWTYLKSNPSKSLKMQKTLTGQSEELGFIFPKNNIHEAYMNEFFESGFGFTSTKAYRQILEAHLGYEIIDYVEVK
jgi:ABC-type amino acid transport substrate-binding protein